MFVAATAVIAIVVAAVEANADVAAVAVAEPVGFGFDFAIVCLYFAHASVDSVGLGVAANWPNFVPSFDLAAQFLLGLTFAASGRSVAVAAAAKMEEKKKN